MSRKTKTALAAGQKKVTAASLANVLCYALVPSTALSGVTGNNDPTGFDVVDELLDIANDDDNEEVTDPADEGTEESGEEAELEAGTPEDNIVVLNEGVSTLSLEDEVSLAATSATSVDDNATLTSDRSSKTASLTFSSVEYGSDFYYVDLDVRQQSISLDSSGTTLYSYTVSNTNTSCFEVSSSNSIVTIAPVEGLDVGTYTDTVTVKKSNGITSFTWTITVSLAVTKGSVSVSVDDIDDYDYCGYSKAPELVNIVSASYSSGYDFDGSIEFAYYLDADCITIIPQDTIITVGTYYVKATVAGTDNYEGSSVIKSFNVNPSEDFTFELADMTRAYNGTAVDAADYTTRTTNLSEPAVEPDSTITYTYYTGTETDDANKLAEAPSTPGTYTVVAYSPSDGKYAERSISANFTIEKGVVTVTGLDEGIYTVTFDGEAHPITEQYPVLSATYSDGTEFSGDITVYYDGTTTEAPITVGRYQVTATVDESDYYDVVSSSAEEIIQQATFEFTFDEEEYTFTYDAEALEATDISYTRRPVNEEYPVTGAITWYYRSNNTVEYTEGLPTDAGNYYVYAVSAADGNYAEVKTSAVWVSIEKAPTTAELSLDAFAVTSVYPDPLTQPSLSVYASYSDDAMEVADENVSYLVYYRASTDDDWGDASVLSDWSETRAVGYYKVVAVFAGDDNHQGSYSNEVYFKVVEGSIIASLYETNAADAVTFDDNGNATITGTYDGTEHGVKVQLADPTSADVSIEYTGTESASTAPVNAGTYTATITIKADNYVDYTTEVTIVINKATFDVSGITFTDDTVTYDGLEHSIEINGSLPDGLSITYSNNAATKPGTYNATATFVYDEANYNTVEPLSATLVIEKCTPGIVWNLSSYSFTYTGEACGLTDAELTVVLENGETLDDYTATPSVVLTYYTSYEAALAGTDGTTDEPVDAGEYYVVASLSLIQVKATGLGDAVESIGSSALNLLSNALGLSYYEYYTADSVSEPVLMTIEQATPSVEVTSMYINDIAASTWEAVYGDSYYFTSTVTLADGSTIDAAEYASTYGATLTYTYYYDKALTSPVTDSTGYCQPTDRKADAYYVVASLSASSDGNYTATVSTGAAFKITWAEISNTMFSVTYNGEELAEDVGERGDFTVNVFTYTGSVINPVVSALAEYGLIYGVDYTIDYWTSADGWVDAEAFNPINVGTYNINVYGLNGNWHGDLYYCFSIVEADMEISAESYTGYYDGAAHGITLSGVPEGATVTYATSEEGSYTADEPTFTNATLNDEGDVEAATVYFKVELTNYNTYYGSATVTIKPVQLLVSASASSSVWTGSGIEGATSTVTGFIDGEDESNYGGTVTRTYWVLVDGDWIVLTESDTAYIDAATGTPYAVGTYKYVVVANADTNGNYLSAATEVKFNIAAKSISFSSSSDGDTIYNAEAYNPVHVSVKSGGEAVELDDADVTYAFEELVSGSIAEGNAEWEAISGTPVDAGTYRVTATFDKDGYESEYVTYTFTINPAATTLVWTYQTPDKVYDTTAADASTADVTVMYGTDAEEASIAYYTVSGDTVTYFGDTTPTAAGTYKAVASYAGSRNYEAASDIEHTFTISKATPAVTISDKTTTYSYGTTVQVDDAVVSLISPDEYTDSVTYCYYADEACTELVCKTVVANDGSVSVAQGSLPTNAGTYYVLASIAEQDNYTAATSNMATLVIEKAEIASKNLSEVDGSCTYDAKTHTSTVSVKTSGTNSVKGGSFSVSYVYYLGEEVVATVAADGTVEGTLPTAAGTYTIVYTITDANGNYKDYTDATTLTIDKARYNTNDLTLSDKTVTYNAATQTIEVDGTLPTGAAADGSDDLQVTYAYYEGSLATGEAIATVATDGTVTGSLPVDAGTYTVVANFVGSSNYYDVNAKTAKLVIEKAPTTLVWNPEAASKVYDTTAVEAGADVSGLQGSDVEVATIAYYEYDGGSWKLIDAAPVNAGSYKVVANYDGSSNYQAADEISTEFTISKAVPTIAIEDKDADYTSSAIAINTAVVTLLGSDTYAAADVTYRYVGTTTTGEAYDSDQAPTNAGTYTVTATLAEQANYVSVSDTATLSIAKVDCSVVFTSVTTSMTYGDTYAAATAALTLVGSDEDEATITYYHVNADGDLEELEAGELPSAAGRYVVVASYGGDANTNYNYAEVRADVLVDPAVMTVVESTDGEMTKVYDGEDYAPVSVSTEAADAEITYTYTGTTCAGEDYNSNEAPVDAGSYTVTASVVAPNYTDYENSWSFTIEQANPEISLSVENKLNNGEEAEATVEVEVIPEGSYSTYTVYFDSEVEAPSFEEVAELTLPESCYVAPTGAGTYWAYSYLVSDDTNYTDAVSNVVKFKIAVVVGVDEGDMGAVSTVADDALDLLESGEPEPTDADMIVDGNDITYVLAVNALADVDEEEEALVEAEVGDDWGYSSVTYMDVTLTKFYTDLDDVTDEGSAISQSNVELSISVPIPASVLEAAESAEAQEGTWCVLRVHEGELEVLDSTYDAEAGTIEFASDAFSTYAIAYTAPALEEVEGDSLAGTGDVLVTLIAVLFGLAACTGVLAFMARRRREQDVHLRR